MITGSQLRDARVAAGWTQEQLAERLGVTLRTIGNWERANPPAAAQARLRAALREHLDDAGEPPLRSVSDAELLAEIARRFARGAQHQEVGRHVHGAPIEASGVAGRPEVEALARAVPRVDGREERSGHEARLGVDEPDDLAARRRALKADQIAAGERPAAARNGDDD